MKTCVSALKWSTPPLLPVRVLSPYKNRVKRVNRVIPRSKCDYHDHHLTASTELIGSLSSLGKLCWMRLEESVVRFTIIPDQGTQVWAQLPVVRLSLSCYQFLDHLPSVRFFNK